MNFRLTEYEKEWYQILDQEIIHVWRPSIQWLKVIDTEILRFYGNNQQFRLWFNIHKNHMELYQYIKVTFACNYNFENYPFDSHECDFDFGMIGSNNQTAGFEPISVMSDDSTTEPLDYEKFVPNDHLPYRFSIEAKEGFGSPNFKYFAPFVGVKIKLAREQLGTLVGSFYTPTAIFGILSMISFFIPPDVVRFSLNY